MYETRVVKLLILPVGEPIFSSRATSVEIDDEAAGEFIVVSQSNDDDGTLRQIRFDATEWEVIKIAIEKMISLCNQ